jgi:hypothetical protein
MAKKKQRVSETYRKRRRQDNFKDMPQTDPLSPTRPHLPQFHHLSIVFSNGLIH